MKADALVHCQFGLIHSRRHMAVNLVGFLAGHQISIQDGWLIQIYSKVDDGQRDWPLTLDYSSKFEVPALLLFLQIGS